MKIKNFDEFVNEDAPAFKKEKRSGVSMMAVTKSLPFREVEDVDDHRLYSKYFSGEYQEFCQRMIGLFERDEDLDQERIAYKKGPKILGSTELSGRLVHETNLDSFGFNDPSYEVGKAVHDAFRGAGATPAEPEEEITIYCGMGFEAQDDMAKGICVFYAPNYYYQVTDLKEVNLVGRHQKKLSGYKTWFVLADSEEDAKEKVPMKDYGSKVEKVTSIKAGEEKRYGMYGRGGKFEAPVDGYLVTVTNKGATRST